MVLLDHGVIIGIALYSKLLVKIVGLQKGLFYKFPSPSCTFSLMSNSLNFYSRYNEAEFNCYTFVLSFLRSLRYGRLSEAADNRTEFCEKFIIPRTTAAGKYISLFRKLRQSQNQCYVHKMQQSSLGTNSSVAITAR